MEQVQPTCIIMSTRVPDSLLDKVKEYCKQKVFLIDSLEPISAVFTLHKPLDFAGNLHTIPR
jgi:hypothetical protein